MALNGTEYNLLAVTALARLIVTHHGQYNTVFPPVLDTLRTALRRLDEEGGYTSMASLEEELLQTAWYSSAVFNAGWRFFIRDKHGNEVGEVLTRGIMDRIIQLHNEALGGRR